MNDLQHEADTKELQVEVRILKGLIDVVLGIISNFVDLWFIVGGKLDLQL